jgi:hypothetical protein
MNSSGQLLRFRYKYMVTLLTVTKYLWLNFAKYLPYRKIDFHILTDFILSMLFKIFYIACYIQICFKINHF